MQWFRCDKDNTSNEYYINFTQIEAVDGSNNKDVPSRVKAFKSFEKGL